MHIAVKGILMFKLKKWFKWYNKDEDYIIYTLKSSLTYCQRAIEFYQEKYKQHYFCDESWLFDIS